ncbi:hypothetical protein [Lentzea sp. NPDC051838]|uniref:hypothetical protein n=1 Tax=Lentzea sp. NPDC051838 TaxID=3154849 RepID=UPI003419A8F8
MRPLLLVMITLLAACTVKPVPTTTYVPVPTPTTTPAPGPVKYAFDAFPDCAAIQRKVPSLPPPVESQPQRGSDRLSLNCRYSAGNNDGRAIFIQVELYDNVRDQSGAERARSGFFSAPQGMEKDPSVSIASEARWADPSNGPSCRLELLDENAYLLTGYNSGKQPSDPRSETCRGEARTFAEQIFEAVQPK